MCRQIAWLPCCAQLPGCTRDAPSIPERRQLEAVEKVIIVLQMVVQGVLGVCLMVTVMHVASGRPNSLCSSTAPLKSQKVFLQRVEEFFWLLTRKVEQLAPQSRQQQQMLPTYCSCQASWLLLTSALCAKRSNCNPTRHEQSVWTVNVWQAHGLQRL